MFLTGATGGMGRMLLPRLSDIPVETILLTVENPQTLVLPRGNIRAIRGDIVEPSGYARALEGVDLVLHMAAVTHSNRPAAYYRVNTEGTDRLLRVAEQHGVKRFVFLSTRAVGKAGGAYSDSKAQAEELVKKGRVPWTIVRPAEIYGLSSQEAIARIMRSIDRMPFIPVIGDGSYKVAPVHIDDVLEALMKILFLETGVYKTYTLAGPQEMTYVELVDKIQSLKKTRKPKLFLPLWMFRFAAAGFALIQVETPLIVRDQIPRLLCEKSADISQAVKDLGYSPRPLA